MKDIEELLEYGLPRIGEQARAVDLDRRVTASARSLHRRRVVTKATAVAAALALAVPITATVLDRFGAKAPLVPVETPTPAPSPSTDPTPSPSERSDAYDALGPDGYGPIKLGMPLADALATGELELLGGTTKQCAVAHIRPRADEGATALISEQRGVVAIMGPNLSVGTPEGIHINSTEAEFERTYPDFRRDLTARLSAPVPGNAGARYVAPLIWVGPDPEGSGAGGEWWVVELDLVRDVQDECLTRFDLA